MRVDDTGRCDLCGTEHGERSQEDIDGDPAWCCSFCAAAVRARRQWKPLRPEAHTIPRFQ